MKKKSAIMIAIILMSIGFASISTTLIINGNAKVSENNEDFSVIFTAANIDGKDVYSTVVDDTKKTITFETSELKTLNQTSILTYEVTNNSSQYDADVTVTCVPKTGTTAKYTSIKNKLENDATVVKAKSSINGTLTVTLNKTATEEVSEEYTCKLEFNAVERNELGKRENVFASDSWSTIAANVKNGNTSKYDVGDTKTVDLGSLGIHTVRIANMSACESQTSETACGFVVEFADIITKQPFNSTNTNVGGWRDSELRTYVNGTIYNALPSELQNIIATTKVISGHGKKTGETNFETQDKLYLLNAQEILNGNNYDTSVGTSKQLDYYKNQGVTASNKVGAIKQYNGRNSYWWRRSANSSTTYGFLAVSNDGAWSSSIASNSVGVSPAFRLEGPWVPTYYAFGTPTTASATDYTTLGKNVFAAIDTNNTKGVCINDNGLFCIKINDYDNSVAALKNHFGESTCSVDSSYFDCRSDAFFCSTSSRGSVSFRDSSTNESCTVLSSGTVNCH